jgi:DNA polymerase-4
VGVGPVAGSRLHARGIETIGELARAPEPALREALGSFGPSVARLARGEDLREVEAYREAKSYSEENTFAEDLSARRRLEAAIRTHAEAVARRLRRDRVRGRTVTLKLKLARRLGGGRYPQLTRSRTLRRPTDDGAAIAETARDLLLRADLHEAVRLVGVSVSTLEPGEAEQLPLLPEEAEARRRRLNAALDAIRERFGAGALEPALSRVERAGLSLQIKRGEE